MHVRGLRLLTVLFAIVPDGVAVEQTLTSAATRDPEKQPVETRAPETETRAAPEPEKKPQTQRTPYRSKAYGARLETDPPGYVKPMSAHAERYGVEAWKELDWLDFGLEHRTRFELHDDNYTPSALENRDERFLLRTQLYIGVHHIKIGRAHV